MGGIPISLCSLSSFCNCLPVVNMEQGLKSNLTNVESNNIQLPGFKLASFFSSVKSDLKDWSALFVNPIHNLKEIKHAFKYINFCLKHLALSCLSLWLL